MAIWVIFATSMDNSCYNVVLAENREVGGIRWIGIRKYKHNKQIKPQRPFWLLMMKEHH